MTEIREESHWQSGTGDSGPTANLAEADRVKSLLFGGFLSFEWIRLFACYSRLSNMCQP